MVRNRVQEKLGSKLFGQKQNGEKKDRQEFGQTKIQSKKEFCLKISLFKEDFWSKKIVKKTLFKKILNEENFVQLGPNLSWGFGPKINTKLTL